VVLLPVDDPADRELPSVGRALFRGADGEQLEVDTDDPAGRADYRRRWEQRREALVRQANRLGIAIIPITTDQDVHRALMEGLSRRMRSRARL
jgi:uncharacterized protein (DUF58 family)